jgi:hypothetical protein
MAVCQGREEAVCWGRLFVKGGRGEAIHQGRRLFVKRGRRLFIEGGRRLLVEGRGETVCQRKEEAICQGRTLFVDLWVDVVGRKNNECHIEIHSQVEQSCDF